MKKIIWIGALCVSLFLNESIMAQKQKVKVPDVDKKTYNELNRLLEEEKYEELEQKVRKNLEKKKSYTLLYFLAMSLYSQDKYNDEVKKTFEDLISLGIYEFEANSRLAVMYVDEKNYEKAKNYAIRAVEVGTEKKEELAKAYHNAGVCHEKIRDMKKAIAYYEKAIETNNAYYPAYLALGSNHYNLGNYGSALEYLEKYIEKYPDVEKEKKISILEIMSYSAGEIGNDEKVEKYAKMGLDIDTKNKNFVHYLADLYAKKGYWKNFTETWKGYYNAVPSDNEAPYWIGYSYSKIGNNSEALYWLKIAARNGNTNAQRMLRSNGVSW